MKGLSSVDRDPEALTRAIEIARNSGEPGLREQIDRLMERDGWGATAEFCVYCCQRELIRPRLWQPTPADIDPAEIETIISRGNDGVNGNFAAATLLKRMLRAGLSRYEPRPVEALAAAKEARRRADSEPTPAV